MHAMHVVQSAQIKYIIEESVCKCYNDCFLKCFLLEKNIKIIYFLKKSFLISTHQNDLKTLKKN
jgi:hypothetical protein